MPETPTPGSRAYEAYRADLGSYVLPWSTLTAREQAAWAAAAQAVLALVPLPPPQAAPLTATDLAWAQEAAAVLRMLGRIAHEEDTP